MKNVHITINGPLNSGKSTIAAAIADALRAAGLEVNVSDDSPTLFPSQQEERLVGLKYATRVNINAITDRRNYP
jgi:deoxyadenosine/deoxycytidine kinase